MQTGGLAQRAAALLFAAIFFAGLIAQDMAIKNQVAKKFTGKTSRKLEAQYLLFLPREYNPREQKRWPLILFLHGAGERGSNIAKVAVHGPPKIVKSSPDFEFIVVSPQCPAGQSWDEEMLLHLLNHITKKHKVDQNRIYLTGLSMGGFGTWSLGLRHPERFAAIAPICGGGDTLKLLLPDSRHQTVLKKLPVWAFHGAKDEDVPVAESERMVNALKGIGNEARLTVYPGAGHDSWTETYNNPELYKWFLDHTRPRSRKANRSSRSKARLVLLD